jgi:23S rRNA (guanosine2251-2'-O)-methyltransferase
MKTASGIVSPDLCSMNSRRNKQTGLRKRVGSHNRCWIWGRNVVAETLRARRWPIAELALGHKLEASVAAEFRRLARSAGIPLVETDEAGLAKLCRAEDHQGCAARMEEFPYLSPDQFHKAVPADALIVVLDRIQDSFNFGAIIRSVESLGLDGVVIGAVEQCGVNSQAARSSAGAVNYVPLCRVDDVPSFTTDLMRRGWQVWGASERGSISLDAAEFHPPLALVIGNEATGIHPDLWARCTGTVRIPMAGRVGSLNAAVSAGILCYAAARSRRRRPQEP